MENFYDVLGISKDASNSDIKKSYRKLAIKYHPDKSNDGDEIFKKVTEAYSILSDESKRHMYDVTGVTDNLNIDPHEIFTQLFKDFKPDVMGEFSSGFIKGFGGNIKTVPIDDNINNMFKDMMPGVLDSMSSMLTGKTVTENLESDIVKDVFKEVILPKKNKPDAIRKKINIDLRSIYIGKQKRFKIKYTKVKKNQEFKDIEIIKLTLALGDIIIENKGNERIGYKERGDVIVTFICKDSDYEIKKYDLILNKTISIKELYSGFEDKIIKPNGEEEEFIIKPEELIDEQVKIIKNVGLLDKNNKRGNIIINYNIKYLRLRSNIIIDNIFI